MNTTTAHTINAVTLRDRIAHLAQAQAMKAIQAHANPASMPKHIAQRATVAQLHSTTQRYAMNKSAALAQAMNNLATANWIAQGNSALGRALQRLAMCDMNSLRGKNATAKQCSVVAEYSNIGRFWG